MFLTSVSSNELDRFFRHSINVFDRLDDVFQEHHFSSTVASSFPPHNIRQKDNSYLIEMAIAGFSKDEITVTKEKDYLRIEGKKEEQSDADEFLTYRGIAARSFKKSFVLGEHMKVLAADIRDGMLYIGLEKEIPEEDKPQVIGIGTDQSILSNIVTNVKKLAAA
jgi:molecular chaperone IbpA